MDLLAVNKSCAKDNLIRRRSCKIKNSYNTTVALFYTYFINVCVLTVGENDGDGVNEDIDVDTASDSDDDDDVTASQQAVTATDKTNGYEQMDQ